MSKERTVTPKEIFLGDVKSRSIFPLLILHLIRQRPEYGNSIIHRIQEMSAGVMSVSPNTIYPILRRLEEKGYVEGAWEKPDTRSRRFYEITASGEEKYREIKARFEPRLAQVKKAIAAIDYELYG